MSAVAELQGLRSGGRFSSDENDDDLLFFERDGGLLRSRARGVIRLSGYLVFTLFCVALQLVFMGLRLPIAKRFPRLYHRGCAKFLGFKIVVKGQRRKQAPTLFVCNHISYSDITMLGAIIPGCFVAKSEVETWPAFGFLAKLQRTVFIKRQRGEAGRQSSALIERLQAKDSLILFPEGTSSDGTRVLPFKSSLFAVAEMAPEGVDLQVQPVSIAYTKLNGIPLGRNLRPFTGWFGDMDLMPHLWDLTSLGTIEVQIKFHEPLDSHAASNRKEMAKQAWEAVSSGVINANRGH